MTCETRTPSAEVLVYKDRIGPYQEKTERYPKDLIEWFNDDRLKHSSLYRKVRCIVTLKEKFRPFLWQFWMNWRVEPIRDGRHASAGNKALNLCSIPGRLQYHRFIASITRPSNTKLPKSLDILVPMSTLSP